jgi:hypothetical protein
LPKIYKPTILCYDYSMKTATPDNHYFWLGAGSLFIISGAAVYLAYQLNWPGIILALLTSAVLIWLWQRYWFAPRFDFKLGQFKLSSLVIALAYLIFWGGSIYILLHYRNSQAMVSPWQVVDLNKFLPVYLAAAACLTLLALKKSKLFLGAAILYYWLSFSVVLLVYQIGYGFDPFVHQATVKFISEHGQIAPKPFYYAGQYALETIIHKLTFIPIDALDKFLLPTLAAVILPWLIWRWAQDKFGDGAASRLVVIAGLILSFTPFIVTTPQGLAYILVIAVILLGQLNREVKSIWLFYLLSVAAIFIQPIAGLPCLLLTAALHLKQSRLPRKELIYAGILVLNIILLPLAFYWLGKQSGAGGPLNFNLINLHSWLPQLPNKETIWLNFAYGYGSNLGLLATLLIAGGLLVVWRRRRQLSLHLIYLGQALTMLAAYLLTKLLPFSFLINYEQNNYANRVLYLALLLFLPSMLAALVNILERLLAAKALVKFSLLIFMLAALGAALYMSYPRFDDYFNSHGYAVAANDVAAVRWIAADSPDFDYVVLANQQVSAAGLRAGGFAKYFKNNIFYYPLPTGGLLYQQYLAITKKPTLEPVLNAMALTGADKVYVVINKYWFDAKKINDELKLLAASFHDIGNGDIYIYKFSLKALTNK